MILSDFIEEFRPLIEDELRKTINQVNGERFEILKKMMTYHMGWEGVGAGPESQGKRIRPMLVLLCCSAVDADWRLALPAALAVELLHNFSLIHDDIQDRSTERRGRPSVWSIWGIAQAINTGDLLFTLANLALLRLDEKVTPNVVIQSSRIFQQACVLLTQGQFQDISFENREDLDLEDYCQMIGGKTAALLSACCELGALVGGATSKRCEAFKRYGYNLGMAFQVQDDWLGIWGDPLKTGKSIENDLVTRKMSLPVIYGLQQAKEFAHRWHTGSIHAGDLEEITACLEHEGAERYTLQHVGRLTSDALNALEDTHLDDEFHAVFFELTNTLLRRVN
jgi:geranylgeranyl diphosphate synthase type I